MKNSAKFDLTSFITKRVIETLTLFFLILLIVQICKNHNSINSSTIVLLSLFIVISITGYLYLYHSTLTDKLTKIHNTDKVINFLIFKSMQKKLPNYSAAFINLRNFKYVNRVVGNDSGDIILRRYAQTLKKFLTKGEDIGRLGGDNFVAIVYKHRIDDFLDFLKNISVPVTINGYEHEIPIFAHCGIYSIKPDSTIGDALNKSSIALNYAKINACQEFIWYKPEMSEELYKEKEIAFYFKEAVKNRDFKIYYQPIVDVTTEKMIGAEALVRWEYEGNLISPDDFIGTLERTGLVSELDFYVLDELCKNMKEWERNGYPVLRYSSNFSKVHLSDPEFGRKIFEIITLNDVRRTNIVIELTESSGVENDRTFKDFLQKMADTGIPVEIDDFGTGYSSIDLLKNVNIRGVKIDKSFIDNIEINNGSNINASLVRNLIHTCHDLKKTIICEGVENEEQKNILKDMRCNLIQGYLYDKPLSKKEYESKLIELGRTSKD